jgi:hypothetical protein
MAIENAHRSAVNLKLNMGTRESTGGMIVRTVSLGNLMSGAAADKIMSVVNALAPILARPVYRVERQEVTILEN